MSRYDVILRDVETMRSALGAAIALTSLQQNLLDAIGEHKGDLLTDLAKKPQFRGIHFAKLMTAAQALHKKGLVTFDGKFLLNQRFPPTFMQDKSASVSAAKDTGNSKNDKKRKATITDLVRRASSLAASPAMESFPEVAEAVKTVMNLSEFIGNMDTATSRLKAAPPGSEECEAAQELVNALRANADMMLAPLMVTLETMENLVSIASEMETQFATLSTQVKGLDEKLKRHKERLAAAANAVQHAVKLG